ncbi:manganese superoxide dismutase [Moniliophthora roreri MCA 2997]|uniref:Manganese superoxide dismutase n=2 Tax=Moniliophthora roreri TaxID=221103 RepID=V2XMC3_MONRO|nr:manganese superoxide dismutase [Moniliophthora roreri MCA 2997]KAI3610995.1 manganese superoxide dismutase [Moniliophthora roreri]
MRHLGTCITRLGRHTRPSAISRWNLRALHTPKPLKYRIEEGLGEFLPPAAYRTVAVEYQQGLLERLNEEARGTELEGMSVVDTIIKTAVERHRVLAFNYASLALNNNFFLEHLAPPPKETGDHQHKISVRLDGEIRKQHGSLAQLKSTFSAAALGMFTNGWVWLVTDPAGNLAVLPTFGPGTLLVRSRTYMAPTHDLGLGGELLRFKRGMPLTEDSPEFSSSVPPQSPTSRPVPPGTSPSSPASGVSGSSNPTSPNTLHPRFLHTSIVRRQAGDYLSASLFGSSSTPQPGPKRTDLYLGEKLFPLFCVSVNEHAWLSAGYGVWGKEEWLKKFWTVLDWEKVSRNYDHYMLTEANETIGVEGVSPLI